MRNKQEDLNQISVLRGTGVVFRFSLIQNLKGIPFRVMTILCCAILILILPVVFWISGQNHLAEDLTDELAMNRVTVLVQQERANAPDLLQNVADISDKEMAVTLVISCVIMLFVMISGEGIATAIVTEKSSKVLEVLLTSVKPMAIVLGKILSVLTSVFLQIVMFAASLFVSWNWAKYLAGGQLTLNALLGMLRGSIHVVPAGVIAAVLMFILGLFLYGLMAGVVGAGVSRVEDTTDGLIIYNILLCACSVMGVLMARLGTHGGYQALVTTTILFPLTSPFIVPAYLALGKISAELAILSFLLLAASVAGMAVFVSRIYDALIFYRGELLKVPDILKRVARIKKEREAQS